MEKQLRPSGENEPLREDAQIALPAMMVPSFRTALAVERKVEKRLMLKTWGGIGDQICAEPTMRFAIKSFKDCEVFLASETPQLFTHLPFKRIFNVKEELPIYQDYFCFEMIQPLQHLQWEFMSHMITNCVDYPSLCAFRCQLPTRDREVQLAINPNFEPISYGIDADIARVVLHPGRHWQSKTFPKWWWDRVIGYLTHHGIKPVIIGANTDDNRGTVDIDAQGCIDLRNQLSILDSATLLQKHTSVLLTNDSSPLHMAVAGDAWIGFVATCKHPDYITHWRKGEWSWRMKNHGKGGVWDVMDYCPNKSTNLSAESVPQELLESWLPRPETYADWAIEKAIS